MKIKISRSFSMKKQIKQYEPVDWFCSAELEVDTTQKNMVSDMEEVSRLLNKFCQDEVEKSESEYISPLPKVVPKFDEFAPANIKEEPFWVKKDLKKVNAFKNPDIAENAKTDSELSTEAELEEEI